jgi:hypothetical protein
MLSIKAAARHELSVAVSLRLSRRIDRNYCDGYGFRFRAMVAEAYRDYKAGQLDVSAVASPFTM